MFKHQPKILVIDDERLNIQLLFEGLSDDYGILAASNGVEGLKTAKEQQPDLILLDIILGDMHGHDVCKALKQDPTTKNIPIIFVTSQDTPEDEMEGLELGAVDYFKKPFSMPLARMRIKNQIELKQKTDLLEHLSLVDALTGIANRRQFDERLEQAIRYVDRNHRGLSLIMVDVDNFKEYNDTYGHVKGDNVLKIVASILRKRASRPLDFVARYGGEEFSVLLIDSAPEEAHLVAEKMRMSVENANLCHLGSSHKVVTISLGVSHVSAEHKNHIKVSDFIEDADECLYEAKRQGRNRVVSSQLLLD